MSEPEFILSVPAPIEESVSSSDDGTALTAKKTKQQILDRLTTQQLKFCREMVRCPKPKQAAINAGYNPKSARQHAYSLLHEEKYYYVREALQILMAEAEAKSYDSKQAVVRDVLDVYEQARLEGDLKSQIKILDIRARMLGMYTGSAEAVTVPRKTEVTLRFSPSKAFADEQSLLGL